MRFLLSKRIFGLMVLIFMFIAQSIAQTPNFLEPCAKGKEPPAESGPQHPTLCQRYSPNPSEPNPPAFQIGSPGRQNASQIIALIGSDQLSGIVNVVGNFNIDVDFTFLNTVVFVNPNVQITVDQNQLFTLENAKLFCCTGLWYGIYLRDGAHIDSKNWTEIEDATIAVSVPCRRSQVFVSNTTFNRNIIGIRVGLSGQFQAPCTIGISQQFETFSGNTFSCTSPLNGTQNGTGFTGIQVLGNRILRVGTLNSAPSLFTQIRYGIFSPLGTGITTLIVNRCHFENILDSGISQSDGTLTTNECHFTNCFANGIVQGFTRDLTVDLCRFVYLNGLNGTTSDFHNGIFATRFGLGAQVAITHSYFEISHEVADGISRGIHLDGGVDDVSTETAVTISNNDFRVQTGGCTGLYMTGDFVNLTPNESWILNNNFTLFNHNSYVPLYGADLQGDFQRFSIQANDFFGEEREDHTLNHTEGIILWGAGNSIHNEISSNVWHLPNLPTNLFAFANTDLFSSLRVTSQDLASICYNQFFNVTHAGTFWDLGHSVYSNNIFANMAHGPEILLGMIGAQTHQGNQWIFPAINVEGNGIFRVYDISSIDGYHIKCGGNPFDSHFLVHTEQATKLYDADHPFHPFVIIPDLDDELFEYDAGGTPQQCALIHLAGDVPELDKALADGNMAALQEMTAAEIWQHQRNLYRLLQTNPDYLSAYSGFPNFLAQHQNGSIGKFYQINTLLEQSATISEGQKSAVLTHRALIRNKISAITQFDNLLAGETNPTTIATIKAAQAEAAEEIEIAQEALNNLQQQYQVSRGAFYPQALSINAQVNAIAVHETNEKAVNQVVLNALINQEGGFTEQDAQLLNGITSQCPKMGGTAVLKARSLLSDCYETPVNDYITGCMGEPSTESMLNLDNSTGNRSILHSTHTNATVLGQEIVLDVPFEFGTRYSFYDLNGRTLQSGELDASLRFQMPSGLATGIYICSVTYASGKVTTQKIVLAH